MFNALYTTNFLSTLNDNYQKMLGMLVVTSWVESDLKPLVISVTGAALVLPYIFCSPIANRAAQVFGKQKVVRVCKILEIPIVLLSVLGFLLKDPTLFPQLQSVGWITPFSTLLVILAIFLIGIQSSMYSPAKYGLIRDIGGIENVSKGMGGMESLSFLGMLLATALAAVAVEQLTPIGYSSLLVIFAVAGYISSLFIRAEETNIEQRESLNPFGYMRTQHRMALRYRGLNSVIYVLSIFWWFATTIQLSLIVYCQDDLGLTGGEPGMVLCIAAIGISLGCVISGQIGHKVKDEVKRVPIYGLMLSLLLIYLFMLDASHYILFTAILFVVGLLAGLFKVPLDAVIQSTVTENELSSILAYFNQVSFIFMLGASLTYYLIMLLLPGKYVFIMMALVMIGASLWLAWDYPPIFKDTKQRYDKKRAK